MPFISVIIPSYNRASFLKKAIASVLNQTYKDFEIIVIDDGSTDDSQEIIESEFSDFRLRYFKKMNEGASAARNYAFQYVTGEWIAFLDSDDFWRPCKLARSLSVISSDPAIDFIHTSFTAFNEGSDKCAYSQQVIDSLSQKGYLLSGFGVKTSTLLIRSSMVFANDITFGSQRTCGDYVFFWKSVVRARKLAFIPYSDTVIRISGNNLTLSHKTSGMIEDQILAINDVLNWMRLNSIDEKYYIILDELKYWQSRNLISYDVIDFDYVKLIQHISLDYTNYGLAKTCRMILSALRMISSSKNRQWLQRYATGQYTR